MQDTADQNRTDQSKEEEARAELEVLWKPDSTVQCSVVKGSDPDFEKGQNMNKKICNC